MRLAAVTLATVALVAVPTAFAKGPLDPIQVCGPERCVAIEDRVTLAHARRDLDLGNAPEVAAAPLGAYWELRAGPQFPETLGFLVGNVVAWGWPAGAVWWVRPSPEVVRVLRAESMRLRPYATPSPRSVRVDGRSVGDRNAYARLFGSLPRVSLRHGGHHGWRQVTFHWEHPNPWSDHQGRSGIRFDPRTKVLFRADGWYGLPAESVPAELRAPAERRWLFAVAAAAVLALLPVTMLLRRRFGISGRVAAGQT
jgi:hypothetical protein